MVVSVWMVCYVHPPVQVQITMGLLDGMRLGLLRRGLL